MTLICCLFLLCLCFVVMVQMHFPSKIRFLINNKCLFNRPRSQEMLSELVFIELTVKDYVVNIRCVRN